MTVQAHCKHADITEEPSKKPAGLCNVIVLNTDPHVKHAKRMDARL